jgi:uncharacterized protein YbcI
MQDQTQLLNGGPLRVAISNALSQVLVEFTGRGPKRVRTTISDDLVICLMHDTLNKAERTLVDGGKRDLVLEMRRSFQEAMSEELTGAVTRLTGRDVVAFMSANHLEPDLAVEFFMLAAANGAKPAA